MYSSFTIFKKGLLLVAIPLVAQAVFIGVLIQTQAEAAAAQRWAVHTKEVIAKVEETYRRLLEGYAGIRNLIVSGNPAVSRSFAAALERYPGRSTRSEGAGRGQSCRNRLGSTSSPSSPISFLELLAALERAAAVRRAVARHSTSSIKGPGYLGGIRSTIDAILAEEVTTGSVADGPVAAVVEPAGLDLDRRGSRDPRHDPGPRLLFLHGVIKRLAVLRDNARRLRRGTQGCRHL